MPMPAKKMARRCVLQNLTAVPCIVPISVYYAILTTPSVHTLLASR